METINKYFFIVLFTFIFLKANAQVVDSTTQKFAESYRLETEKQYQKAINQLKPFEKKYPYEVNLRLAWLNYLLGDYAQSVLLYKMCMSLAPTSIEPILGILSPLSQLQDYESIIIQYKNILFIDSSNTNALYALGNIYYQREDYYEAKIYLKKILQLYPLDINTLLLLGSTYYKENNFLQADYYLNKVLLVSPNNTSAYNMLSLINSLKIKSKKKY